MCGIVGYIGHKNNAIDVLLNGLTRLEYRGYDSAGIAYVINGKTEILKEKGKIINLKEKINKKVISHMGIGHTRWATHGTPNKINSHPHQSESVTIVHNGIIENYNELKNILFKKGYKFKSDTDTEVAAVLLNDLIKEKKDVKKAIEEFFNLAIGSYAIGMIVSDDTDTIYAIKNKSPLIVGIGNEENFIASDVPAILEYTNKYAILEDNEYAIITKDNVSIYDKHGNATNRDIKEYKTNVSDIDKSGYKHFMLKEIYEQPDVVKRMINTYLDTNEIPDLHKYQKIVIIGCGSAMHAGLVGKSLIEEYCNIPVEVEIASEFRYKKLFLNKYSLVIAISQSGETADTLEGIKIAKSMKAYTIGIVNVEDSSIARAVDKVLYTNAGPEIAVATTKAYLSQITLLSFIAASISNEKKEAFKNDLKQLPDLMLNILNNTNLYNEISDYLKNKKDVFFIGRGIDYSISMEGSLKLKEIAYIHSEAYPAGELKHGTISLIEKNTPVIGIATDETIESKTISNIKEVKARGAKVFLLTNNPETEDDCYDKLILVDKIHPLIQPILNILPLQLIAYMTADKRGCDIDKPKNLAKSVTVE